MASKETNLSTSPQKGTNKLKDNSTTFSPKMETLY